MPEENPYAEKMRHMALLIHEQNRAEQIQFYKDLSVMGKGKLDKRSLDEDKGFKGITEAEKHLKAHIKDLKSIEDEDAFDIAIGRLAIADFFIRRTKELGRIAVKRDDAGLYSLYISMRNTVSEMLQESFFSSRYEDVLDWYLDAEPIVAACSELCGLGMPKLPDLVSDYQKGIVKDPKG